jgi:phospholipid/cholesterol/gamma-HCH transport system permease protein
VSIDTGTMTFAAGDSGAHAHRFSLCGAVTFDDAGAIWAEARRRTASLASGARVVFDMSRLDAIDGATMALLVHHRSELAARGIAAEFVGAAPHVEALIHLYAGDLEPARRRRRRPKRFFDRVGRRTLELVGEVKEMLGFIGAAVRAMLGLLKEPRTGNWRAVLSTMEKAGANAVPIVLVVSFLVGFVIAYQAAAQLEQFGASVYVADVVGKSISREMGPLMTAIIVCSRSGAAFAAELGSMKVSEEIDALRTMGFGPVRYLVLPRIVALMLVVPVLTLLADVVGIFAGYVVAMTRLELTSTAFLTELRRSLELWDVGSGLIKSVVFALAIALISCQQGFATRGGAEGVGRRTTTAVVTALLSLIVIDAGFTIFFQTFGL